MIQGLAHAVRSRRELLTLTGDIETFLTCPLGMRPSDQVWPSIWALGLDKLKGLGSAFGFLQKWVLIPTCREQGTNYQGTTLFSLLRKAVSSQYAWEKAPACVQTSDFRKSNGDIILANQAEGYWVGLNAFDHSVYIRFTELLRLMSLLNNWSESCVCNSQACSLWAFTSAKVLACQTSCFSDLNRRRRGEYTVYSRIPIGSLLMCEWSGDWLGVSFSKSEPMIPQPKCPPSELGESCCSKWACLHFLALIRG